ncbi:MAG TPA: hypothetical protein VNN76_09585 [Bacteroidota bacterium]|nr:hypothetical protein [Bacteroidota bacterium]
MAGKSTIIIPAVSGVLGFVLAKAFGVTDGLTTFLIGVGSLVFIGGGTIFIMKRRGG